MTTLARMDPTTLSDLGHALIARAEAAEEADPRRKARRTDTERWLRSSEAFDAFTDVLLCRLSEADPANGHGIGRVRS
jgi:hypothetical protein